MRREEPLPEIKPPPCEEVLNDNGSPVPLNERSREDSQEQYDKHLDREETRRLRKMYSLAAFFFAYMSLLFWMGIICMQIKYKVEGKEIFSDTALGIITAGATVNMIAAFRTVIKGLFQNKKT